MTSRLPRRLALGYGVAEVGASLSYNAVNFFFLFFLVEALGLRPSLAGAVLLAGRAVDAVTDPLMGILSDRAKARWGRRKPFVWAGALPFGLTFALLWFLPEAGPQGARFALALGALVLHALVYTLVQVPYLAMTPELAPDYQGRTVLSGYRVAFATLASLVAAAAPPLLVAALNARAGLPETARFGWRGMGLLFGLVMSLAYGLMALLVREPRRTAQAQSSEGFFGGVLSALRAYGYPQIVLLFATVTVGLGLVSSMLPFYLSSRLQLPPGIQTAMLGLLFVVAALSVPGWTALSARLGKRGAFAVGLTLLSVGLTLLVLLASPGRLSGRLVATTVLAGAGVGAVLLFPWAMLPDVVEFDALARGTRREGLFYALFTFFQKAAFALGAALNGVVLGVSGYLPEAAVQTPEAVRALSLMVGPVAASFFLLALPFVWCYPITRAQHERARAALGAEDGIPSSS